MDRNKVLNIIFYTISTILQKLGINFEHHQGKDFSKEAIC